jgi:hypothetical protein
MRGREDDRLATTQPNRSFHPPSIPPPGACRPGASSRRLSTSSP